MNEYLVINDIIINNIIIEIGRIILIPPEDAQKYIDKGYLKLFKENVRK